MKITDHLDLKNINLDLKSTTKEEILEELVQMLEVPEEHKPLLLEMVLQREQLGSTGIGEGVAIPHGRSLIIDHLHLVFGLSKKGVFYQSLDRKKASFFFLIVAPHREVSNQYLPLLGTIAKLASNPTRTQDLRAAETPQQFLELLRKMDL